MPRDRGAPRQVRFSSDAVARFAAGSGDRNPLHVDPSFARATAFGSSVVHGALVAIGLLGALADEDLRHARGLTVRFAGPALPDRTYDVEVPPARDGQSEARLVGRGQTLARLLAVSDPNRFERSLAPDAVQSELSARAQSPEAMPAVPREPIERELAAGELRAGSYRTGPELFELARCFGAHESPRELIEALGCASYTVGMEIPGLHSLLAGITLVLHDRGHAWGHAASVREYDGRTGQLVLDGALCGEDRRLLSVARIDCFWQGPTAAGGPGPLPGAGAAGPVLPPVVIVGASRGFGAKLCTELLARGHRVHAVYSSSAAAAEQLAQRSGGRREGLVLHRVDARLPDAVSELAEALRAQAPLAGLALCAAPPPLSMGLTADSAIEVSEYVSESVRLAAVPLGALLPLLQADGWVLFCSTSALDAPPRDWPQYVSAKGALEGLAQWVAARSPRLRTVILRPPAMRTDMTNTPSGRLAATDPGAVAAWIVERLSEGKLATGLSLLSPEIPARVPA